MNKRLGMIGTCYNSGISHIASGFAAQFPFKALLVDNKPFAKFPERFNVYRLTKAITASDIDWLLSDIDVLFIIETPYEWAVIPEAKRRGIKVIFMPMYEWLNQSRPELKDVDLFICPSIYTYEKVKGNKVLVDSEVPVDTSKFKPRVRKEAKVFLHNSGHGGVNNRNSTPELIEAMKYVCSDEITLIINCQYPIPDSNDPRIIVNHANFENYWDMYHEGDVWIMPAKYGMAFLGIQEASAAGMPIMITDMEPFNQYLPKELLIPHSGISVENLFYGFKHPLAKIDAVSLAKKIDEVASMDITKYSEDALARADAWSWKVWHKKYEEIFNS